MPRLLVTGGSGYLGGEIVRLAAARGWDVRATHLTGPPSGDADWRRLDNRDAGAVEAAVAGVDAVVHTAYRQCDDAWTVNADASAVVAHAARDVRLVHISSDLVFAGTVGRYREEDVPAPVNAYGRSKAEAERRVADAHPGATIARTSLIYGGHVPGQQERLARTGTRFFTDEIRSPVQVGDLAAALLELIAVEHAGPLHLGGADDVSRFEFALLLGADPSRAEQALTTPDRAPDVSLDSSLAGALLSTCLRGCREVLA